MQPRWKYAQHARKARYCEDCGRRLKKSESVLCKSCFEELMKEMITDEDDEAEESEEREEEE